MSEKKNPYREIDDILGRENPSLRPVFRSMCEAYEEYDHLIHLIAPVVASHLVKEMMGASVSFGGSVEEPKPEAVVKGKLGDDVQ
jgi:hypothetical protein